MTISTTVIKNSYSGTGSQDVFAYTFKIAADSDMEVIIRASTGTETVKTITTHYTVSGAGTANGGNVTFTSGNIPTNTETVVLRRKTTKQLRKLSGPAQIHKTDMSAFKHMLPYTD